MRLFNDFGPQSNITQPSRKLKEEKNVTENFSYVPTSFAASHNALDIHSASEEIVRLW